ncbi:DUF4303 domain-containing protein [Shewanella sp. VB17]|uniref:DUF4303 domain-containing protein n=1 Tax=Shewanella sp. VB17 TaxID=2739432 RepID=UPI001565FF4D|nr:DUF4303 domain-containing protein [Shewanella sp. VB17]NRD71843.1 DUF4303 domain-containing protein [Shewanella sp. VB17]
MDFDTLRSEIEEASQKCFSALKHKYSEDDFCGYSLYSDSSAMSISPALNSKKHFDLMCADDPEDSTYYRWSPGEWAYESEGAEFFQEISKQLIDESKKIKNQEQFINFKANVYEACVQSLENLSSIGFLNNREEDSVIVFTVSDSEDPEEEVKWIERLNKKELSDEFTNWIHSL